MRIGIPRESKEGERRVALLPDAAGALRAAGHELRVERGAGSGIGRGDDEYQVAGARITDAAAAWGADLVVKVKEIQPADLAWLAFGATIFSFHHLPREPERTRELARRGVTAIAFEMLQDDAGRFPLLAPMSVIAGRMAVEHAARALGHAPSKVVVLGAGNAGLEAERAARAMGSRVVVLGRSGAARIEAEVLDAELVVGAVFVAGQPTPKLLPRSLVRRMRRGAVIADISIDAGGVAETSRPTTHAEPTYVEEGVIHYCVPNIPAAAPEEAAAAISSAVLPYVRRIADAGIVESVRGDPHLKRAVLLWRGAVAHPDIAAEAGLPYTPVSDSVLA